MQPGQRPENISIGKPELVELLTGVISQAGFDWLDASISAPLQINPSDMDRVWSAVSAYKENRIQCYGLEGDYTQYFMPAFNQIEAGYNQKNFTMFCQGCELLLGLISKD